MLIASYLYVCFTPSCNVFFHKNRHSQVVDIIKKPCTVFDEPIALSCKEANLAKHFERMLKATKAIVKVCSIFPILLFIFPFYFSILFFILFFILSFIFYLLSFIFYLLSFIFYLLSFIFYLLSFIFYLLSFIFYLLSFIFYLLSFIFYLLSFIFYLLSFIFYRSILFYSMVVVSNSSSGVTRCQKTRRRETREGLRGRGPSRRLPCLYSRRWCSRRWWLPLETLQWY